MATQASNRRKKLMKQVFEQREKSGPDFQRELQSVQKQIAKNDLKHVPRGVFDKAISAADEDIADRMRSVRDNGPTEDDIAFFKKQVRRS